MGDRPSHWQSHGAKFGQNLAQKLLHQRLGGEPGQLQKSPAETPPNGVLQKTKYRNTDV